MPTPRPDSIFTEYQFTEAELAAAKVLSQAQISLIQTLYAQTFKERGSVPLPEETTLDRSYICQLAELDGRLGMLQQLLDNHQEALKYLNNPTQPETALGTDVKEIDTIATRAAKQVHQIQEQ